MTDRIKRQTMPVYVGPNGEPYLSREGAEKAFEDHDRRLREAATDNLSDIIEVGRDGYEFSSLEAAREILTRADEVIAILRPYAKEESQA